MPKHGQCRDCGKDNTLGSQRCNSCAAKERWKDPEYKKKLRAVRCAKWKDPEYKKRMSANTSSQLRSQWADPKFASRQSSKISTGMTAAWHNPQYRRSWLTAYAERERRNVSSLEFLVKEFLEANFADVIHQYVPDEDMSPGIYDFYIPAIDAVVEVDGNYWHASDLGPRELEKKSWALTHDYTFVRIMEDDARNPIYLRSLLKELYDLQQV